jgi:hypothetical protein
MEFYQDLITENLLINISYNENEIFITYLENNVFKIFMTNTEINICETQLSNHFTLKSLKFLQNRNNLICEEIRQILNIFRLKILFKENTTKELDYLLVQKFENYKNLWKNLVKHTLTIGIKKFIDDDIEHLLFTYLYYHWSVVLFLKKHGKNSQESRFIESEERSQKERNQS